MTTMDYQYPPPPYGLPPMTSNSIIPSAPPFQPPPPPQVPQVPQVPPLHPPDGLSRFDILVKNNELSPAVSNQLREVLTTCEIVLLCDDSSSMNQTIAEEGTDAFAVKKSTRWLELKKLASIMIDFITSINPKGLDIYFLNRPKICNVTDLSGLQSVFSNPPNGGTPLIRSINQICNDKSYLPSNKSLLIVVITDGEPNDGNRNDLYNTLVRVTSKGNVHISFAECTDNPDDMEYLDQWDGQIKNFDNTDDYREELQRIKSIQGPQFKFNYTDYVIKILLATFVRWYFNLDQTRVNNPNRNYQSTPPNYNQVNNYPYPQSNPYIQSNSTSGNKSNGCCTIL